MSQLRDDPKPETMLRVVRVVAPAAALTMAVTVVVGLASAPEGAAAALFDNVWGVATVIDLYLALLATWVWIAWRERSAGTATLWAVLLVVTGSVALWVYVAWRAAGANDMQELLLGKHDIGV
jgi:hypothetical protein